MFELLGCAGLCAVRALLSVPKGGRLMPAGWRSQLCLHLLQRRHNPRKGGGGSLLYHQGGLLLGPCVRSVIQHQKLSNSAQAKEQIGISQGGLECGAQKGPVSATLQLFHFGSSREMLWGRWWKGAIPYPLCGKPVIPSLWQRLYSCSRELSAPLWPCRCSFSPVAVGVGSLLWERTLVVSQCELGLKTGK